MHMALALARVENRKFPWGPSPVLFGISGSYLENMFAYLIPIQSQLFIYSTVPKYSLEDRVVLPLHEGTLT